MSSVFKFRKNQPVVWYHRLLAKSNQHCLYCGRAVGDGAIPSDKEHLIGRWFGPDGAFGTGREFNLIFRACKACNNEKADLERHLSSVTIFNSPARLSDPAVDTSAQRKAASDIHPTERKPVRDSHSNMELKAGGPGFSMHFSLTGPPQPVEEYVGGLAFRQVQGLFSLLTTADPTVPEATRLLPQEHFRFVNFYGPNDWGNPQLVEVSRRVRGWPRYAIIHTAGGFFRAVMRREDGERGEWFWALEWNRSLRVVGGITDQERPRVFDDLPPLTWKRWDATTRYREERPLQNGEDILFEPDEPEPPPAN